MAEDDELYLVDGSGFIFRAYYAMAYSGQKALTNPEGTPVGAVFGFTNMILKLLKDYHAPYIAVIFDAARVNFRNEIYAEYKANRDETPEELIPQFPLVREATAAFDIPAIELEGYEADDLIATYTKLALAKGKKVVIVSSDKDLMQLIRPGVRMLDPMKQKFLDEKDVMEKFGVTPDKVVEVQSLIGDPTDNVPGVPGIGPKTAAELINQYGDLETLLKKAGEIKQNKRRETIITHAEDARMSKKLVSLADDVPVPVKLEDFKTRDGAHPGLLPFLQKQGFNSIIKRLGGETPEASPATKTEAVIAKQEPLPPPSANKYTLIDDVKTLKDWIADAKERGILAFDTETTSLTPAKAKLVGISICSKIGEAAYIPVGHVSDGDLFGDSKANLKQIPVDEVMKLLKPLMEDESVLKVGHNMKYDWQMFAKAGIRITPCDDTMLLSYVLDGTAHSHGMDNLVLALFNHENITYEEVTGSGKKQVTFDRVPIEKALHYAAEDAEVTLRMHRIFKERLAREKMVSVYENIERPLIPIIAEMELTGIKLDPKVLKDLSKDFGERLAALEKEIHKLAGHEFNVASPKQVGTVLFDELGLEGGGRTKGGAYSTSVGVLEDLAEDQEIVRKILEHRQLAKLKSTYSDSLLEEINPVTGRVHTSFAMAHVNTGRLSSSDPNLQNIPIRTEEGRKIRAAFIAEKGHVLLSVDYSQVELRLAAALAGVEALKKAFNEGVDIHALTASQVFGVPLDQITPDIRRNAKAVNFGIIYGISGWGLAKQLGIGAAEANEFISKYLSKFSELRDYMEDKKEEARINGFVKTLYGRKCVIDGAKDSNPARRGFAERQAINAPLQGTAADIMKIAMTRMPRALKEAGLNAKMLLQVHDELVFEVPESELEQTAALVRKVMESVADIGVPLQAESGSGKSWAEAH